MVVIGAAFAELAVILIGSAVEHDVSKTADGKRLKADTKTAEPEFKKERTIQ